MKNTGVLRTVHWDSIRPGYLVTVANMIGEFPVIARLDEPNIRIKDGKRTQTISLEKIVAVRAVRRV